MHKMPDGQIMDLPKVVRSKTKKVGTFIQYQLFCRQVSGLFLFLQGKSLDL